jgi:hypothetical protein
MTLTYVQNILSVPRFERYLIATGHDFRRALKLYKANLKVSQSFHPMLGTFEVILRNRLDEELAKHFGNKDWTLNKKHFLPRSMVQDIQTVEDRLKKKGGVLTHGKIIADQNLSFWTGQFEKTNFKKLGGSPIQIFRLLPTTIRRDGVSNRLNQIRQLRNRINHNEPICFSHNTIDFTQTATAHRMMYEILDWIDLDIRRFLKGLDTVPNVLKRAASI